MKQCPSLNHCDSQPQETSALQCYRTPECLRGGQSQGLYSSSVHAPSPTQAALLAAQPPLYFSLLSILNSQQPLSGTLPPPPTAEIKRHSMQLQPEESQAFAKHQVLGENHTVIEMLEQPLTPETQNCHAELMNSS